MFTAEYSGTPVRSARAVIAKDTALRAVRTWIVLFNNPVFTELQMRVYSSLNNAPDQLLYTFDTKWTLSQLSSEPYAVQEVYFECEKALPLIGGETYHFVIYPTSYTGTETSHIGWVRTLDDPPYSGYTPKMNSLNLSPFRITYIGAKV